MDSGVDVARVFLVAAMLCERGSVTITSAEKREDPVGKQLSTPTLKDEKTWQAAAAKMELLPARPAINRERIVSDVCMVDNRSGLFCLVSSTRHVYIPARVLLDSSAQPLMLGKAACINLGVQRSELKPFPFKIQTSLGVLYLMDLKMDYWTEKAAYRPSWQSDDGRMSELPVRFISGARLLGSSPTVLASVAGLSGVLAWPDDLLEGNMSANDTSVYEDVEEIVRLAAKVSSSLDVPLWRSCHELQQEADRLVKKAWSDASLPEEIETS
ncbi:hypothetical protein AXG93_2036s1000 [Marchantia polymorpha subsp. ruderalis]|uniref:Uncharacterized protein n=1 Tax=Marchantia polymorpha subsp. ruderalis TaxID=1480154 RepID=A0A176VX07_MARPO|nr:hypothetical protein AXG93_2036s1000 [Marchantia polymorpha subsp. ruderalis]